MHPTFSNPLWQCVVGLRQGGLTTELMSPTVQVLLLAKLLVLYMSKVNRDTAMEAMVDCCATGLVMPAEQLETCIQGSSN